MKRKISRMFDLKPPVPVVDTVLQRRLRERLDALRRNPREVSLAAGLGPDALRTILKGRSRSPRSDNLAAIARELQCDVNYLLGTTDELWPSEDFVRRESGIATGINKLELEFNLGMAWDDFTPHLGPRDSDINYISYVSDVYSLPEFLPGFQHLEYVTDNHAAALFPAGSYLHCISHFENNLALHDNEIVIVERQRISDADQCLIQRTARRLRLFGDTLILQMLTQSTNSEDEIVLRNYTPSGQPEIFRSRQEALAIPARVLRAIHPISGPSVLRKAIRD